MDIELLRRSCERLPKLLELNSPAIIIVSELEILMSLALSGLHENLGESVRVRLAKAKDGSKP